jgi:ATP diphosphatase
MLGGTMPRDPQSSAIARLIEIMARLRDPASGCPWDIEQSFASIAPYTIEEAYEVADAIERGDTEALREELGDLLLQVVYHARMAEEAGDFDFEAVATAISDKMVRRHPHVFGPDEMDSATAQTRAWEAHKAAERQAKAAASGRRASVLDGVASGLPALTRALKLQRRASRVGFDWPAALRVVGKIEEEVAELKTEIEDEAAPERVADELGDLLFALVNLARHLEVDPESALRHANAKFERRFRAVEARFDARGQELAEASLEDLEAAWQAAKAAER